MYGLMVECWYENLIRRLIFREIYVRLRVWKIEVLMQNLYWSISQSQFVYSGSIYQSFQSGLSYYSSIGFSNIIVLIGLMGSSGGLEILV